jgi:type IX secretion system PorP/SprF family membrane protein
MLAILFTGEQTTAQDLHFSQWMNSPLITNPANTGFIPDADYRVGANYRNQWSSFLLMPYKSYSAWGDAQLFRDKIESGWLGVGGVLLQDVAGSGSLTSTKAYLSLAYHQMIGEAHLLSFGINAGWSGKRINTAALKFPDQFDGRFFDKSIPTSVVLDNPSINYADVQAGLNYAYFPTDKLYINAGFSIWHLNRPRESFFTSDVYTYDPRIPYRYIGFVNSSFKTSPSLIVSPMAYFTSQAGVNEFLAGAQLQYDLTGDGEKQLLLGVYNRLGESLIPQVGFELNSIRFSFTYDATTSSLKSYNQSRGALEFSVIRNGFYPQMNGNLRQSLCPSFR